MIVWSALRTACYSIYLLSLAWLIIYAYGNVRGGGKTKKRWEEKWQMCIRCAHTQRLFAFYATLCETYYGLVTHAYIHPILPTPLWQANISKQLHKCALECALESNRIESRHRQGAKSWTRKRDWEEEEAGGTQCDWAQNLIAILNRRNQLNDDIKCMQYRATNDTNNPSKMNSSSGSEIVL